MQCFNGLWASAGGRTQGKETINSDEWDKPFSMQVSCTFSIPVTGFYGIQRFESLSALRAQNIQEIPFMSAREATIRFGTDHMIGAILISTGGGLHDNDPISRS